MAKYNIPNLYIANRDRSGSGGGSSDLTERVEALEAADGYNTSETAIGTSGDDVVYRKIYKVATPEITNNFNVVDATLTTAGIKECLRLSGTYKIDGAIRAMPIRSDGESLFLDIDASNGLRVYVNAGVYTITSIVIVVEYTKATT